MGKSVGDVPIIDLQEIPEKRRNDRIREACEQWGCFRVMNHGIPFALLSEVKQVVRSLLDLPEEVKRRNTDMIFGSGYVAPSQKNPLYEALGLYDIASFQAVNTFCEQLGASPPQRETIQKYAKTIYDLSIDIAHKLAQSFGLKSGTFKGWPCQFRINKYHFTPETVGQEGVQIHTDSGFLTILQDDENVSGLEVMDESGAFIPVDPLPGTLVVIIGDMGTIWSNGRLRCVKHRVQCKEGTVRISIASFMLGPKEEAVEAPPEFVDSDHPPLYMPITYEEYRKIRLSKLLRAGEALALIRNDNGDKSPSLVH